MGGTKHLNFCEFYGIDKFFHDEHLIDEEMKQAFYDADKVTEPEAGRREVS